MPLYPFKAEASSFHAQSEDKPKRVAINRKLYIQLLETAENIDLALMHTDFGFDILQHKIPPDELLGWLQKHGYRRLVTQTKALENYDVN